MTKELTTEQLTEIAMPIAEAIARNCRVAPQLVFPHLFLGLKSLLGGQECGVPPVGWRCTREMGHDGPCAAFDYRNPLER